MKGSEMWRDKLLSQHKMHLICYLGSEIDQLLFISIWRLWLIILDNFLENGKYLKNLLILQLRYLYKLNINATIDFILIFSQILIWQLEIPIIHLVESLITYKVANEL